MKKENFTNTICAIFIAWLGGIAGFMLAPQTLPDPLQVLMARNPHIESMKFYIEHRGDTVLYSIDFNDFAGYDYLTAEEVQRAVVVYPKSIYKNK